MKRLWFIYGKHILGGASIALSILLILSLFNTNSKSKKIAQAEYEAKRAREEWRKLDSLSSVKDSLIRAWEDSAFTLQWDLEQSEMDRLQSEQIQKKRKNETD